LQVAEAFKAHEPASEKEDIQGVLSPDEVVTDQPVWDLNQPEQQSNDHQRKEKRRNQKKDAEPVSVWRRRDPMAWYSPASFHPAETYGIHFDAAKVRRMALRLEDSGAAGPTPDDWLIAAILTNFWHETCHAWVEDLCHLTESLNGENTYKATNGKYHCYIFMEEALCNTVALWMLKFFFRSHRHKKAVFEAVMDFMRSQPKGYRDFRRGMPQWAAESDWMSGSLQQLLTKVYEFSSSGAVAHAFNSFLKPPRDWHSGPGPRRRSVARSYSFPIFTNFYMRAKEHPLYLH
jgi:hypothetical protein